MSNRTLIQEVRGRRVWDSRGRPTVEAEVILKDGSRGRAIAPAGASTGSAEAIDRRDGGEAFGGYDVSQAVAAIGQAFAPAIHDHDATDQALIDQRLIEPRLLTDAHRRWLDAYHKRVQRTLSPLLGREDKAWLKEACRPL